LWKENRILSLLPEVFARLTPRRVYLLIFLACLGLLGFGLYLQHVVGLEPCPMCIVQRYAMIVLAVVAAIAAALPGPRSHRWLGVLALLVAGFGAFVAARQSWLQWYPPEIATCGRDFYGMIENFPLQRAIPMIFKGSGDCSAIDWTFLGGTIANWSFLWFLAFGLAALSLLLRKRG
jgi:protein dithiol:quinone oxidoreductase